MDRYVIREPRAGSEYSPGHQMSAYPMNSAASSNIMPEVMYFSGPFVSEPPNAQRTNIPQNMNPQYNNNYPQYNQCINGQQPSNVYNNMDAENMFKMNAQNNIKVQSVSGMGPQIPQNNLINQQRNFFVHSNINQDNISAQTNNNFHMAQNYGQNNMSMESTTSGIDPRYLAAYNDNSAQFIVAGQQIQRNPPITSFGDHQNRSFNGIDTNKHRGSAPQASSESQRVDTVPKPTLAKTHANIAKGGSSSKKANESNLPSNDIQNQIATRADKLKALQRSGPRAFSGPVQNVLKWHKSLQGIGVLIFYEVVGKCVSVRPGESCSKNLVVRDDSGPAMQVVYYEIDFLLPELKIPCTVRVIGRMLAGTCRFQAFSVRVATGDDVASLPRRAAIAAHHVAKLCKEYGTNSTQG